MNQPKFKFGDKVAMKGGATFCVTEIKRIAEKYYYNQADNHFDWVEESKLELYFEPKPKKLYAHITRHGCVRFSNKENGVVAYIYGEGPIVRAPEYDIEYPLK